MKRVLVLMVPFALGFLLMVPVRMAVSEFSTRYTWKQAADEPDCWALLLDGKQIGGWRQSEDRYSPLVNGQWGPSCNVPIPPPVAANVKSGCDCCGDDCQCAVRPCDKPECRCVLTEGKRRRGPENYGIVTDKIGEKGERYLLGDRRVSKKEALKAVTDGKVPDDRHKPSLTFAGGSDAERKAAVDAAVKAGLGNATLIQDYPADSALLKPGFVIPSTYLQSPDGKVIGRLPNLANAVELAAVRKAVPEYDPTKDPNPTQDDVERLWKEISDKAAKVWADVSAWVSEHEKLILVVLGIVAFILFRKTQAK
jgi:hypothetical protein